MDHITYAVPSYPSNKWKYDLQELNAICASAGFTRRGNAHFRVIGDGVLQVLKFERFPSDPIPSLELGLFSMYSVLMKQWFTAQGCIPRYPVVNFEGYHSHVFLQPDGNEHLLYTAITPDIQMQILKEKAMPWLDGIVTQKQLVDGLCWLESMGWKVVRKNDMLKFAPYLYSGNISAATAVLDANLEQHQSVAASYHDYVEPEQLSHMLERIRQEENELQKLKEMVQIRDNVAIHEYFQANYRKNCGYAQFCMRNKPVQ